MPRVSMTTGPLAGKQFAGLWELMDAQAEMRRQCPHTSVRVETGTCGAATSHPHHWRRERCQRCSAIMPGHIYQRIAQPNVPE